MKKNWFTILCLILMLAVTSLACSLTGGKQENSPSQQPEQTSPGSSSSSEEEQPEIELGERFTNEVGGYSFNLAPDYSLEMVEGMVNMLAEGANADVGPVITMIGSITLETTNQQLYEQLQSASGGMTFGEPSEITVDGVSGLVADVTGEEGGESLKGKVVLVMVTPTQQFILLAGSPEDQWDEMEPIFEAVLDSVEFFTPTASVPALGISPGMYIYTDANVVRDIVVYDHIAYAATLGGVVAWDLSSGSYAKYTTLDGMGHISANAITICNIPQTRIIVGTLTGLSFFDPATRTWDTTPITPADSGVNTSRIDRLFCDQANNRLLIGYYGLGILDLSTGEFQKISTDQGLSWDAVTDIAVSGTDIWVASGYNGISRIRSGQVTVFDEAGGMPEQTASALAAARDGSLWVGTSAGLLKFNGSSWTLYDSSTTPGMVSSINELEIAPDGRIWVVSAPLGIGGICLFNPSTAACDLTANDAGNRAILALALDGNGSPLYGTGKGLYRYNGAGFDHLAIQSDQLASNFVDSFAIDTQGMLWVGTDSGLQTLDPVFPEGSWATYREGEGATSPGGNWGKQILTLPDGAVWVTMGNGEVSRLRNGEWTVFDAFYAYDTIAVDDLGQIWLGDDSKGISVIDDAGNVLMTFTTAEGLPSNDVRALLATGSMVWIGTTNGLARYEGGTLETVLASGTEGLASAYFLKLAEMPDGSLLLGTSTDVIKFDGDNLTLLLSLPGMDANARLTELAVAPDGKIWVGTSHGLFSSSDGVQWSQMTTADGLLTDYISALLVDTYGTVWVGGGGSNFDGGGILRIVP